MKKVPLHWVVVIIIILMGPSCTNTISKPGADLFGKWEYLSNENGDSEFFYELEFTEKSIIIKDSNEVKGFVMIAPGKLKLTDVNLSKIINYKISGDKLTLYFQEGSIIYKFISTSTPSINTQSLTKEAQPHVEITETENPSVTPTIPNNTIKVLWDASHSTDVPSPLLGSYQRYEIDDLFVYLLDLGAKQESTKVAGFNQIIENQEFVLEKGEQKTISFELAQPLDYLKLQFSPAYFKNEDGTSVWIDVKLISPEKVEIGYGEIQEDSFFENGILSRSYLLKNPNTGTWKVLFNVSTYYEENADIDPFEISFIAGGAQPVINETVLGEYSLLIISDPGSFFFDSELEAIRLFVENGGSLLILQIPYNLGYNGDTTKEVSSLFGIHPVGEHTKEHYFDPSEYRCDKDWPEQAIIEFAPISSHALLEDVNNLVAFRTGAFYVKRDYARLLLIPKSRVWLDPAPYGLIDEISPVAYANYGKGKVVAIGDYDFIRFSLTTNKILEKDIVFKDYDNHQLAKNIIDWLLFENNTIQ